MKASLVWLLHLQLGTMTPCCLATLIPFIKLEPGKGWRGDQRWPLAVPAACRLDTLHINLRARVPALPHRHCRTEGLLYLAAGIMLRLTRQPAAPHRMAQRPFLREGVSCLLAQKRGWSTWQWGRGSCLLFCHLVCQRMF